MPLRTLSVPALTTPPGHAAYGDRDGVVPMPLRTLSVRALTTPPGHVPYGNCDGVVPMPLNTIDSVYSLTGAKPYSSTYTMPSAVM